MTDPTLIMHCKNYVMLCSKLLYDSYHRSFDAYKFNLYIFFGKRLIFGLRSQLETLSTLILLKWVGPSLTIIPTQYITQTEHVCYFRRIKVMEKQA